MSERNIKFYYKTLIKFYHRNTKILNMSTSVINKNCINLHWWSMNRDDHKENVGDMLSPIVCNYLLKERGLSFSQNVNETKHLYAIGSIIQGGAQDATVWGSGLKNGTSDLPPGISHFRKLDIRSVRGPKTRETLLKAGYACPEIYGDPAILMPDIYEPQNRKEKRQYLLVLHKDSNYNDDNFISPVTTDYKLFIDEIYNSELVISSSLHGIILAESYGIPAILLSDSVSKNRFKYDDYYYSTGRLSYSVASSVEEALDLKIPKLPDLSELKKGLYETFPYDLWN